MNDFLDIPGLYPSPSWRVPPEYSLKELPDNGHWRGHCLLHRLNYAADITGMHAQCPKGVIMVDLEEIKVFHQVTHINFMCVCVCVCVCVTHLIEERTPVFEYSLIILSDALKSTILWCSLQSLLQFHSWNRLCWEWSAWYHSWPWGLLPLWLHSTWATLGLEPAWWFCCQPHYLQEPTLVQPRGCNHD